MKVLQINAVYGYKSTGVIVKDIDETVRKNGFQAFVAYQRCSEKPVNGYRIGNALDWKMHAFYSRVFGKQAYFSKCATKKLLKWIDEIRPDVIHLHNLHSNYINLPMLLKYLAKKNIATVVTLHDCWFFTGKCFHFVESSCDKWQDGCNNCPRKKADVKSWFFDASKAVFEDRKRLFSAINNLTIVGCSNWICNEAKKSILQNCKIICINNGVDKNIFKKYEDNELIAKYHVAGKFVILGMANKWLLDDNKLVLDKVIDILGDNCLLFLLGCDRKQSLALRKKSPFIVPVGYVSDRVTLAKYYGLADVFVNLTHADTLPTVNMESICCGTPVITYNSCGSPELVGEGQGIIVEENDVDAVISAIETIMERGFTFVPTKSFDKNTAYNEYIEVYKDISGTV